MIGLGMAVMLTNWTLTDKTNTTFAVAAEKQLKHILEAVPRHTNGAISHRENYVQLWYDVSDATLICGFPN